MFFRRRRYFLNQYDDKAVYFDRKTHEVLEAPKSKLLDTEKSNKMNRHIPYLVVLFLASGGSLVSLFSLFFHGTYSMTTFWSVILIWIAEFAFITILVERALYRNVHRATVTTKTLCLTMMIEKVDENQDDEEAEQGFSKKDFLLFYALLLTVPAVGFYYAYDFLSHFRELLGHPIGGEIVKRSLAGLLLGTAFVVFNQNNFIRNLKLLLRFEEGKLSVVCRDDDNPDVYLKVRMGADQEPVITELEKDENQVLK